MRNEIELIKQHDGPVVVDIETPGQVDPYEQGARVLMVGVALSDTEAYVFTYPYIKPLLKVLQSKLLIAHNAKFERNWLRKAYGFEGNFVVDTMLLAHYVDEQQPTGLEALAQKFFDAPPYGENIDYENEPLESYSEYCALDCTYTYALYNIWRLRAQEPYFKFIMEFSQAVWDMEYNGIGFSTPECVYLQTYLWRLLDEYRPDCDGINLNSPQQVATWLVDSGVPLYRRTASGKLSVSEDATLEFRAEYPVVDQYRKWKDIL